MKTQIACLSLRDHTEEETADLRRLTYLISEIIRIFETTTEANKDRIGKENQHKGEENKSPNNI